MNFFYKVIFFYLCSTYIFSTSARESFNFNFGDKVQILSDKAYRKTKGNIFEAVGNVIITHDNNAIYGEKASLFFNKGDATVIGNVRYIGQDMTLYGSKLEYNFKTKYMGAYNARVISDNYVILGKYLARTSSNTIIGKDAEYTTCRDCPESWSVLGKEVHITLGEYVRIKHAFIKVKGVIVMYVPYIVLPIKKNRESGLLFPKLSLNLDKGVSYGQPWFWAISGNKDLTITPTLFGKKGYGNEFQYRHVFAEENWFEVNTLKVWDQLYEVNSKNEDVKTGNKVFRTYADLEYNTNYSNRLNHHFYYGALNDLDMLRDYEKEISTNVLGPEIAGEAFFNLRSSIIDFNFEGYFNRNLLVENAKEFDHDYVQILPKLSVNLSPQSIVQTDLTLLKNISFSLDTDYTIFKQNHLNEANYIRNATRVNAKPRIDWYLGQLGPVYLKTSATYDYQHYQFPYEESEKTFTKSGVVYESEAKIEFEKVFGLAYEEEVPLELIEKTKATTSKLKKDKSVITGSDKLIGTLPSIDKSLSDNFVTIIKNSYKNNQSFALKHYYLGDQEIKGSQRFESQIQNSDGFGQFDSIDAIRSKESEISQTDLKKELPIGNTLELKWSSSLIRKTSRKENALIDGRSLRDNFSYGKIAYFNVSQGYDLNVESEKTLDHLTRLFVETGVSVSKFNFSASEYYFHQTNEHIFSISLSQNFKYFDYVSSLGYDSFSSSRNKKNFSTSGNIYLTSLFTVSASIDYDIELKRQNKLKYSVLYSPVNNCWRLGLNYEKNQSESRTYFNYLFNFNDNNFKAISN